MGYIDKRRAKAIKLAFNDHLTTTEIADRLEVSDRTIRRWKAEFLKEGSESFMISKAPKRAPNKTSLAVEQLIVKSKLENPSYGSRRLKWYVLDSHGIRISHVTISRILKKRGIAIRIKPKNSHTRRFERKRPNSLWQMDVFYFRIRGVGKVYLFAIIDDHSRFCMACNLYRDKEAINSLVTLAKAIRKHGKPGQLLTDNGKEVLEASFESYLCKKGVRHAKSRPYTPQSKGKIERFWKTLYGELIAKVMFTSIEHAQKEIDKYVHHYNYKRRHGGIGWTQPAKRYREMIKRRT